MLLERMFVNTPQGKKLHGELHKNDSGQIIFKRTLKESDRMRMFNAWSLNPEALTQFDFFKVVGLWYSTPHRELKLKYEDLKKMLSGEMLNDRGAKLAFYKTFGGGETIYIKEEAFTEIE